MEGHTSESRLTTTMFFQMIDGADNIVTKWSGSHLFLLMRLQFYC